MTEKYTGENAPWIGIAPMRLELFDSYRECLDSVSRERKFFHRNEAPPIEASRAYVERVLDARFPYWVAVVPGPRVVGWCDIGPMPFESQAHLGVLGLGVHADFRGSGIGRILLERALKQARSRRIERVELEVFSNNVRAKEMYEKFGFEVEGVKRRARKNDGVYEDIILMALLF